MRAPALGLFIGLLSAAAGTAWQQPAGATHVTKAELDAVFATIGRSIDKQVKVVDVGKDTNVAVGILHRAEMSTGADPIGMIVHHDITEVYYIVSGTGTLATGGAMANVQEFAAESGVVTELVGPSASGTVAEPDARRAVAAGDVVIIPAGVAHGFSDIDAAISYLSIRVDPDQVLPAGYVNPGIR